VVQEVGLVDDQDGGAAALGGLDMNMITIRGWAITLILVVVMPVNPISRYNPNRA
jgi:hypothetical protein